MCINQTGICYSRILLKLLFKPLETLIINFYLEEKTILILYRPLNILSHGRSTSFMYDVYAFIKRYGIGMTCKNPSNIICFFFFEKKVILY